MNLSLVILKYLFKFINYNNIFLGKSVIFDGLKYKIDDFIVENDIFAAKITEIYGSEIRDLAILRFDLYNIEFDHNLRAFEVGERYGTEVDFINNFKNPPICSHHVADRTFLINKV